LDEIISECKVVGQNNY